MSKLIPLPNRSIISISGLDKKQFLQSLVTNDIFKVNNKKAIYSFILNPAGRFLYDIFITQSTYLEKDSFLIDCNKTKIDEIFSKFSFYKLRSQIEICKRNDLGVFVNIENNPNINASDNEISFIDPRMKEMGMRYFIPKDTITNLCQNEYDLKRIGLKLPDDSDLTYEKSFPLEFGFDNFAAIDYKKGCYVGQETTARMHYKGIIRKKIFLVEVLKAHEIEKGSKIMLDDKKIGEILSSVFNQGKLLALALIKNLDNQGKEVIFRQRKLNVTNIDSSEQYDLKLF